jgi:hypothetical protein
MFCKLLACKNLKTQELFKFLNLKLKLQCTPTAMLTSLTGSEVKSGNLSTTHAMSCLHRGMWNGQQYNRSLRTLMCSVITSHNNIIKLPLT